MRRTPHLLLAGALALALPLAACGDDDDSTSPTSAASDGGPVGEGGTLTVLAEDALKFDRDAYDVAAGEITITYENQGSLDHTLLIRDTDFDKLLVTETRKTDEGSVELEPGTYEMYCDIAGHEAAGMVAELTVS